jgi:hypothetical protein
MIKAAENAETHNLQKLFFEAVSSNDIEDINKLVSKIIMHNNLYI